MRPEILKQTATTLLEVRAMKVVREIEVAGQRFELLTKGNDDKQFLVSLECGPGVYLQVPLMLGGSDAFGIDEAIRQIFEGLRGAFAGMQYAGVPHESIKQIFAEGVHHVLDEAIRLEKMNDALPTTIVEVSREAALPALPAPVATTPDSA